MTGSRRGVDAVGARPLRADAAGTLVSPRSGAPLAPSCPLACDGTAAHPLPGHLFPRSDLRIRAPRPGNGGLQNQGFGSWFLKLKFRIPT